jgi:hypothetical protein
MLAIFTGHKLRSSAGSFGARVDEKGMHLPLNVRLIAMLAGWQTAEQFFLATLDFRQAFKDALGWTDEHCETASRELRDLLRGHVADEVLDPPAVAPNQTGAAGPDVPEG